MPSLGSEVARSAIPYVLQIVPSENDDRRRTHGGSRRSHVIMDWISLELDRAAAGVLVRTRKNPHVEVERRGIDSRGYYSVLFKWKTGIFGRKTEYARVVVAEWPELVLVVEKDDSKPIVTILTATDLAPALDLVLSGKQDKSR